MKKLLLIALLLAVSACSQTAPDLPTTTSTTNSIVALQTGAPQSGTVQISLPVDTTVNNDCAGELVDLAGTDHLIIHETINGNNTNINFSENFKDIVGIGETSGDGYFTTSTSHDHITAHKGQTVSGQQKLVMTGPTTQLTVFLQLHFTINSNGEVTAFVDTFTSSCVSLF
jgi:hypothetical protein